MSNRMRASERLGQMSDREIADIMINACRSVGIDVSETPGKFGPDADELFGQDVYRNGSFMMSCQEQNSDNRYPYCYKFEVPMRFDSHVLIRQGMVTNLGSNPQDAA